TTFAFAVAFSSFFVDGNRFLTVDAGNLVRVYSEAGVLEQSTVVAATDRLVGDGNYFWTQPQFLWRVDVYALGSATSVATLAIGPVDQVIAAGTRLAVVPSGSEPPTPGRQTPNHQR